MIIEPFIAHSEMTNEIYIVCGAEKYLVTEQVIKAMQNTGRLEKLERIEHIVDAWNNDASHSFLDMCKINEIIKQE